MGVMDGKVIGATKIVDNGDPGERFNLVLVAEGYRETELNNFASDASHFVGGLFMTVPFKSRYCAINVWRLDVASDESGADDPTTCGGTGAMPRTRIARCARSACRSAKSASESFVSICWPSIPRSA